MSADHTRAPTPAPKALPAQQWRDLWPTLQLVWRAHPRQSIYFALSTLLSSALPAATLYISKLLLDGVTLAVQGQESYADLLVLLGYQVGVVVAGSLLSALQNSSRELLSDSLQQRITALILQKASNLEVEHFEDADTYDQLQQAYREVGARPVQVATQLVGLAGSLITLLSVGSLMARLGWAVVPLILLSALPGVWVSNHYGVENYRRLRRQTHDARVQNYLGSILTSDVLVKEVRLFGMEPYLLSRWHSYYRSFRATLEDMVRRRSAMNLLASLFSALMVALASALVLRRAAAGAMTVGDFSLFALGIAQIQSTVGGLLGAFSSVFQNLLYMRNLFQFLELPSRDLSAGQVWQGDIHTIEFQDVAFRYPLTERDVLRGLSFVMQKGEALALVGENGAGKTTVVKLLTRLFEPTAGRILLNGQDAALFSPRSVQHEMSIIFQDFGEYQLSVAENIALADIDRLEDTDALHQALDQAGAGDFVSELPQGLKTPLGRLFQGGRQLSGGQWQRLGLARLYFRPASVLIFDEPTAALDARAEYETIAALRQQTHERMVLLISHRFSTIRLADQIIVLEDGQATEQGSHEELMQRAGRYATLYNLQAAGYQDRGYDETVR